MKSFGLMAMMVAGLIAGSMAQAQTAAAPAGSTGLCKDGTYTNHTTKRGACSGHKGVQTWFATAAAPVAAAAPAAAPAAPAPAPAAPAAPAARANTPAPAAAAAPGGGAGQVWVNTGSSSKVYHCQGDRWYGKTKAGQYMTAAQAEAQGYHAARGKACAAK